jgi:hypothetical protein
LLKIKHPLLRSQGIRQVNDGSVGVQTNAAPKGVGIEVCVVIVAGVNRPDYSGHNCSASLLANAEILPQARQGSYSPHCMTNDATGVPAAGSVSYQTLSV